MAVVAVGPLAIGVRYSVRVVLRRLSGDGERGFAFEVDVVRFTFACANRASLEGARSLFNDWETSAVAVLGLIVEFELVEDALDNSTLPRSEIGFNEGLCTTLGSASFGVLIRSSASWFKAVWMARRMCEVVDVVEPSVSAIKDSSDSDEGRRAGYVKTEDVPTLLVLSLELLVKVLARELAALDVANAEIFDCLRLVDKASDST